MFKRIYDKCASLTLGLWLLVAVMLLMAVGSFLQGEGSAINEMALFGWLREVPAQESWWLVLTIGVLGLLVLNTVLCSIDSLKVKWQKGSFLTRIAPQMIHLGFLLIVVAHLFSASGALKQSMQLVKGSSVDFPDGQRFEISEIEATYGKMGMPTSMSVRLRYLDKGVVKEQLISPNHPHFYQGHGIYLKDLTLEPSPIALIEVHREPGAGVALAGALLFTVANIVLLAKRRGREA